MTVNTDELVALKQFQMILAITEILKENHMSRIVKIVNHALRC